jgi:glycosyltransferase involved in cell wall biosynthesis
MSFLRYNHPPTVIRVESDELIRGRIIQPTLDKYFLLRGYDAFCFDSSWTKDAFFKLVPNLLDEFPVIPNGINHELFKPIEKVAAKTNIAEAFANPKLKENPIVLLISGESIEESVPFMTELASSLKEVAFLVLDTFLEDYVKEHQENLEFFKVQDAQDYDAMSVIFNAADIAFFPAVLGVPCTYILSVLACGVPIIVAGEERIPEEVGDAGVFIKGYKDSYGTFIAPTQLVSKELKLLLSSEAKRLSLGANAIKQAATYTWDKMAIKFAELFKELSQRRESAQRQRKTVFPMAFLLGYVPSDKSVCSRAIQLPSFRERPMYDALATTLLVEHTPLEVEAVLTHIFKEQKKAKEILSRISSEFE